MRRVNVYFRGAGDDEDDSSSDASSNPLELATSTALGDSDSVQLKGEVQRRHRIFFKKFEFEWELQLHFTLCIASILVPFALSGSPWLAVIPLSLWSFYNALFIMGAKHARAVFPSFDRLKRNFVSSIEEFLPPRLLPVLSLGFLLVVVAVTVTAARLGGPPLCLSSCGRCLSRWSAAQPLSLLPAGRGVNAAASAAVAAVSDLASAEKNYACGYSNGKVLLAFYTVTQSSILIYLAVMVGLLTCLAWKVSDEELSQRQGAESWLKAEDPVAYDLRERMMHEVGRPGSSVRPETNTAWLMFGLVAAFTFVLIGWKKFGDMPRSTTSVLFIGINVANIIISVLLLHVGFYGRLVALYRGNLCRVQFLSRLLREAGNDPEGGGVLPARAWWSVRSFVLLEDLSLDYDVGGLGVSATLCIVLTSFVVAVIQLSQEGLKAILSPPGSYCAYASVYLTVCLIRIFGLATDTYREQQMHAIPLRERIARSDALLASWKSPSCPLAGPALLPAVVVPPGLKAKAGSRRSSPSPRRTGAGGGGGGGGGGSSGGGGGMGLADVGAVSESGHGLSGDTSRSCSAGRAHLEGVCSGGSGGGSGLGDIEKLSLAALRDLLERMATQIETSDPYPCVLGIPVKPALFASAKVYVFLCFAVVGTKLMFTIILALL